MAHGRFFWPILPALAISGCAGISLSSSKNLTHASLSIGFSSSRAKFSPGKPPLSSYAILTSPPLDRQASPKLCGLAAARMIAGYYGLVLNPEDASALKEAARRQNGLSGQALKNIFNDSGFFSVVFPGRLDHSEEGLLHDLDRGRPLIVMLKKGGQSHYAVLAGYDRKNDLLVLNDPLEGAIAMGTGPFMALWNGSGRFTLLAVPTGDVTER